jgi:hypothetical protein
VMRSNSTYKLCIPLAMCIRLTQLFDASCREAAA